MMFGSDVPCLRPVFGARRHEGDRPLSPGPPAQALFVLQEVFVFFQTPLVHWFVRVTHHGVDQTADGSRRVGRGSGGQSAERAFCHGASAWMPAFRLASVQTVSLPWVTRAPRGSRGSSGQRADSGVPKEAECSFEERIRVGDIVLCACL